MTSEGSEPFSSFQVKFTLRCLRLSFCNMFLRTKQYECVINVSLIVNWVKACVRYKLPFLRLFDNLLSKYLTFKIIPCMQWLFWIIYQNYKEVCD